jgi:hypothetical protein
MKDLKADSVLFLTRDDANDIDRDAAKLFARCQVEVRHVGPDKSDRPAVDVLVHAEPHTMRELASGNDLAGRVENAIRQTGGERVRYLQWVEDGVSGGPRSGAGIGDGG